MLNGKSVAVVVPAYNEETQIQMVIDTMPEFVDKIVIVDDCSKDKTKIMIQEKYNILKSEMVKIADPNRILERNLYNEADVLALELKKEELKKYTPFKVMHEAANDKIVHIEHTENGGVGAAIATGYRWCRDSEVDCTAVMAGDGQMDPDELLGICSPVIEENVDYVKGNRLIHKSAHLVVPKVRYRGNSILSMLTKIASGYWHIFDTQTGYTAISLDALNSIDIYDIYPRYGMPNDLLIKLNIKYCTVKEIPIKPIYRVGEQSKMNIRKLVIPLSLLLLKGFIYRIYKKYLVNDFHPLFIFYFMSLICSITNLYFIVIILSNLINGGEITVGTYLGFVVLTLFSFQSLGQAMSLDISDNERLYKY